MTTETVMIYFDDLDAMGVVHNGRYVILFERGGNFQDRADRFDTEPVTKRIDEPGSADVGVEFSGEISTRRLQDLGA
jgi:hypothetical protein